MTHSAHKGTYGDTAVIGGAAGMAGALTLAAQAALAAGSGRTVVVALDPGMPLRMDSRPELLWRGSAALEAPQAWWQAATVVCGCGGGESVATHMPTLLEHSARIVLDADALNALAADPVLRAALAARAARGAASVLTPHPLEAARLLGCSTVVPTLEGAVRLQVPAGSSSGRLLRLRGRGLRWGERRGDQVVEIRVVVPAQLGDDELALYRRLRELGQSARR